jgi:adenosylcobinamide-GDP ribazoletransferase
MNKSIPSFLGAIVFYTTFRIPTFFPLSFERIARWLTLIGLLIGGLLGLVDFIFSEINLPILTGSVLIISLWVYITGGLHLDGVIDTADGLAVSDRKLRLEVMKDSTTGAFGVIAAVILLLIKTVAFSDLNSPSWLCLMIAASWGRWGQLMAIAFYPYLRETGKGAFHKEFLAFPQDCFLGSIFIFILIACQFFFTNHQWWLILVTQLTCAAISLGVGFWFNRQLGGHTGDSYGATVEWSEAFILCLLTIINGG